MLIGVSGDRNRRVLPKGVKALRGVWGDLREQTPREVRFTDGLRLGMRCRRAKGKFKASRHA